MGEIRVFGTKEWEPFEYEIPGGEGLKITAEIRRPKRHEARAIAKAGIALAKKLRALTVMPLAPSAEDEAKLPPEQRMSEEQKLAGTFARAEAHAAILEDVATEDQIEAWFKGHLRNVHGLEVDGKAVETGEALYNVADNNLASEMLMRLASLATLSAKEGKASASRSTSQPASTTPAGESAAKPIESEAGPSPSTAPEIEPAPA
jgi:hypothetical protein